MISTPVPQLLLVWIPTIASKFWNPSVLTLLARDSYLYQTVVRGFSFLKISWQLLEDLRTFLSANCMHLFQFQRLDHNYNHPSSLLYVNWSVFLFGFEPQPPDDLQYKAFFKGPSCKFKVVLNCEWCQKFKPGSFRFFVRFSFAKYT